MESKSYADSSDVDIFSHISYSTWSIYQFLKKKKIVLTSWNVMKALTSETACPRLFHYQKQVLVLAETCAYSLWAQPPEEDSKNTCPPHRLCQICLSAGQLPLLLGYWLRRLFLDIKRSGAPNMRYESRIETTSEKAKKSFLCIGSERSPLPTLLSRSLGKQRPRYFYLQIDTYHTHIWK